MQVELIDAERFAGFGGSEPLAAHLRALVPSGADVEAPVREIIADVRERGDVALRELTARYDSEAAAALPLRVSPQELDEAMAEIDPGVYNALECAIGNVAQVAAAAHSEDAAVRLPQGQQVLLRELPVPAAAIYVPGGRSPYASTVVMGTVTARAAGVLDVSISTPPGPDGRIDHNVLAACHMCGVTSIYRAGGAQAIAALAYGTESVRPVDVVVGPGNLYVQEAKRQCTALVGIDGFAGPSDLMVIFEAGADLRPLVLDLLAQAEHGPGTIVLAVCSSAEALLQLQEQLAEQAQTAGLADAEAVCAFVQAPDERAAIALANAFAPEHLQLVGPGVESLASLVRAAGCLFVGPYAATAFGDYAAGSNHVLPTGGAARFASGLSPRSFRRTMYEVRMDGGSAQQLAEAAVPLALSEGFPLHAASMLARTPGSEQMASGGAR